MKPIIAATNMLFQNDSRGLGGDSGVLSCVIDIKLSLQDRLVNYAEQTTDSQHKGVQEAVDSLPHLHD